MFTRRSGLQPASPRRVRPKFPGRGDCNHGQMASCLHLCHLDVRRRQSPTHAPHPSYLHRRECQPRLPRHHLRAHNHPGISAEANFAALGYQRDSGLGGGGSGRAGTSNNCQTVWGSRTLHRTCSCAKAPYTHMHKWQPMEKVKGKGGLGCRKGIQPEQVDPGFVTM